MHGEPSGHGPTPRLHDPLQIEFLRIIHVRKPRKPASTNDKAAANHEGFAAAFSDKQPYWG
jgi:hypothetical protein